MRVVWTVAAGFACLANAVALGDPDVRISPDGALPGEYIVELRQGSHLKRGFSSPHAELYHHLTRRGAVWQVEQEYHGELMTGAAIKLGGDSDLAKLAKAPSVQSITPVYVYSSPELVGTKASSGQMDNLSNTNAFGFAQTGIDRLHAEGFTGKGISIAIIDTGVDYTHPALGGKMGPGNKVIGGYDFVGDEYTALPSSPPPTPDNDPRDCKGHGTHVAGIVGAEPSKNLHNISGVAYEATINAYRVFSCKGKSDDKVLVNALNRAYADGNDIINLSLGPDEDGWGKSASNMLAGRIAKSGRIMIFAAGNSGTSGSWLTAVDGAMINVGNSKSGTNGSLMNADSAWGPSNEMFFNPSVAAPGTTILSTWLNGDYFVGSGTSMAAPFVAGAAALLLQVRGKSNAKVNAIQSLLQNTATPLSSNSGVLEPLSHQGAGLINAYSAAKTTTSMLPTELLLNDTAYYRGSHQLTVRNDAKQTITYTLEHSFAGTVTTVPVGSMQTTNNAASVVIEPPTLVVPAGQSMSAKITIQPPTGLDPATFPVFSGYIVAKGSDNSTLRSSYLGVAAAMKNMQIIEKTTRLPGLFDGNRGDIQTGKRFTMNGNDIPTLIYRLASGTPKLIIDLVDLSSSGAGVFTPSKRSNANATYASSDFVGRIAEQDYVTRSRSLAMPKINKFMNGTAIPDGSYFVRLRVLKITGDPTKQTDWEDWRSNMITVKRGP